MTEKVDRIGAVASTLCAVHCALCALLPAAFTALGLGFLVGHETEWLFTLVAVGFAFGALILGWRQHSSVKVAGLLAVGIIGLLASRAIEMGSDHHGHDDAAHHGAEVHGKAHDEDHGDTTTHLEEKADGVHNAEPGEHQKHEEHEADEEHDSLGHMVGASVGVLAGFILLVGHISNIRATRRRRMQSPQ